MAARDGAGRRTTESSPPSSLILGVASAQGYEGSVIVAGVAGVVAGAMSMAAGEYVSVHSQQDLERAALAEEREELEGGPARRT